MRKTCRDERRYETSGGWAASLVLGEDLGNGFGALADYLETEIWGQQPAEMRDFLLRASVPPTLTADVCERVLGEPRGPAYLTQAHRNGLFVARLPDGGWRLHDLFRDFLRTQLRQTDPELWHIQGSLLANVDRLLLEIDLERGPDARRVPHG